MATSRPFAYNTGATISGTTQLGNLAIGTPTGEFPTNPKFWNGPDEELGYVIAYPQPDGLHPTPVAGTPASLGFLRTYDFSESSFIGLAQYASRYRAGNPQTFSTGVQAKTWLNANGFWTSYLPPVLSLDASTYSGSGSTWTDSIGNKQFTLYNSPAWSSNNGGYFTFAPSSSQYAKSATSLSNLPNWSVEVWHYYTGTNTGTSPCIVTEQWPNSTGNLNYNLGNNSDSSPLLQAGFFNGAWRSTGTYSLTANNWYHIVGTYDGSTINLYLNNSLVSSASYTGTAASAQSGIVLMRRWDDPPGGYWGGRLSIVNIYDTAISSIKISSNWNVTKSRFGL